MALTPVEIRHITLGRSILGYNRHAVDKLLDDIVLSFEDVWRARADLADKIELLEQELVRHRELETLLTEAHAEARRIGRDAIAEVERLRGESRRIRTLLAAALATIGEGTNGDDEDTATHEVRAA